MQGDLPWSSLKTAWQGCCFASYFRVNGRAEERVSEAQRRIATEITNGKIAGVAEDISSSDGVTKIIEACPDIDILINNVSIFDGPIYLPRGDC